jgi:rare lipoprotein A
VTTGAIRRSLLAALAVAGLAVPASASAQSGGTPAPGPPPVAGNVGLEARPGALLGRVARFRGTVEAQDAGRTLGIERFDALTGGWLRVAGTTVAPDGTFLARWRTDVPGSFRMRAVVDRAGTATAAVASPEVAVVVYKRAKATWYGPGFFGRRTACGQRLRHATLGVAHKRLPCGTRVALYYDGRSIVVPVIDRGPFVRGIEWDLTQATAEALGFERTARLGALPMS